jgi:4-amino-4-deoxy-L-arabinose transferase-like glycosyltransferase
MRRHLARIPNGTEFSEDDEPPPRLTRMTTTGLRTSHRRATAVDAPSHHWLAGRAVALVGLAVWLLATLGVRPLMLPDEGRYVEVAREMLFGDAAVPLLYGLPFFHKPPLMYWLDAAAMQWFGVNAFAARIAPALGGWLMGAAIHADLHREVGPRDASIALGVLATCPFFFVGAQFANHDMLVAGLVTAAVVCARRAVDDPSRTPLGWVVAAWCAMALAVLAKGLIGIVLPALVIGPWLLAQRRWREVLRLMHPLAVTAFALIAAPWFVAMGLRHPGFLDYFFLEQHFRRFAQTGFNNQQPFWFFVPVLLLLTLPWSLWTPVAARRLLPASGRSHSATVALYAWWVAAVVGFFSLPSSKLVGYALPALAPFAALLGLAVARGRAWRWLIPAAALACVATVLALAWTAPNSHRDIGQALAMRLKPVDRVVFVDGPYFDVPFYARMTQLPVVLSDWDHPEIPQRDNWRKELFDAARFAPAAGARVLWSTARAGTLRCGVGTVWFVAPKDWRPPPEVGQPTRVHEGRHAALLMATGTPPPGCP